MRNHLRSIALAAIAISTPSVAMAFGVGTHQTIAELILADLADDCAVTIPVTGRQPVVLSVEQRICAAILAEPEAFRAGSVGPDAFPDLLVGQLTTHPGIIGGWQADGWIKHVLRRATSNSELAFAYGFVVHAASDVFAHTYVNQYSGDVFELTNGGTIAEYRHFALEKFIDLQLIRETERNLDSTVSRELSSASVIKNLRVVSLGGTPPAEWVANTLIFDPEVEQQYLVSKAGVHLVGMRRARVAVQGLGDSWSSLRNQIDKAIDVVGGESILWQTGLTQSRLLLEAANETLKLRTAALRAAEDAERAAKTLSDQALKDLKNAKDSYDEAEKKYGRVYDQYLGLQSHFNTSSGLLNEQEKIYNEAIRYMKDVACVTSRVATWGLCSVLIGTIACIVYEDKIPDTCEPARQAVDLAFKQITITGGAQQVSGLLREQLRLASEALSQELNPRRILTYALLEQAELSLRQVQTGLEATRVALEAERKLWEGASRELGSATAEVARFSALVAQATSVEEALLRIVWELDPIGALIKNWEDGTRRAGIEYIEASWASAKAAAAGKRAVDPYIRWYQCSLSKNLGVPWQGQDAVCDVSDAVKSLAEKIDEVQKRVPEPIKWILAPMSQIQARLLNEVTPALQDAVVAAFDFTFGSPTGRFLELLSNLAYVNEQKLTEVFTDSSAKDQRLLVFQNIVGMVYADLGTAFEPAATTPILAPGSGDNGIQPARFASFVDWRAAHVLSNAAILSKLALLGPAALNRLVIEVAPDVKESVYGSNGTPLYDESVARPFTLLFDAVRSLDGNHQWQAFAPPFARINLPTVPVFPNLHKFGFGIHDHPHFGFRLFVDPVVREKVFLRVFTGPIEGSLIAFEAFSPTQYSHPFCIGNPFPLATTEIGTPRANDERCKIQGKVIAPVNDFRTPFIGGK